MNKAINEKGVIGVPEFIKGKPSDFIEEQIRLSKEAEKTIYEAFGTENFLKKLNIAFPFPLPINLKKDEKIGIRQKRNGENIYVVEDLSGSFKRVYNG